MGGIHSIIEEIRRCSYSLGVLFISEIPANPWKICATFFGKKGLSYEYKPSLNTIPRFDLQRFSGCSTVKKKKKDSFERFYYYQSTANLGQFGSSMIIGKFGSSPEKYSVAVSAPYESNRACQKISTPETGVVHIFDVNSFISNEIDLDIPVSFIDLQQAMPDSLGLGQVFPFGSVMTKIHLDNTDLLVVAHPGVSTLYFYFKGVIIFSVFWPDATIKYGGKGLKLVGETLIAGDVDGDGIEDLIVGAPRSDDDGTPQRGKVYILSGWKLTQMLMANIKPSMELTNFFPPLLPATKFTDHVLLCPETKSNGYELFGASLAIGRVSMLAGSNISKSYVAITSAGLGKLYVFFESNFDHYSASFDITPRFSSLLEKSLLVATQDGWLFVGDSGYSYGQCQQCGIVYGLIITHNDSHILLNTVYTIKPRYTLWNMKFKRFGSVGKVTSRTLFIGSPFDNNGQGSIWAIPRQTLNRVSHQLSNMFPRLIYVSPFSTAGQGRRYTGFGQSFEPVPLDYGYQRYEYIFVGEPYHGSQKLGSLRKQLAGKVTIYKYEK
jgi:hypothetical protein